MHHSCEKHAYEWDIEGKPMKKLYSFELANRNLQVKAAGLWDACTAKGRAYGSSLSQLMTTEANELMAPIQPRMPIFLHPRDYDRWLDQLMKQSVDPSIITASL